MRSEVDRYEQLDYLLFVYEHSDDDEAVKMRNMSNTITEMIDLELAHSDDWYLRTNQKRLPYIEQELRIIEWGRTMREWVRGLFRRTV